MLTNHQEKVVNEAIEKLHDSAFVVIRGSAGVGKTYLVPYLIRAIRAKYNQNTIAVTAPTNTAVAVIEEKVTDIVPNNNYLFKTIYSMLKLKQKINERTGAVTFSPSKRKNAKNPLTGIGILIIDEASMINTDLLKYIKEYADYPFSCIKVVFLGDDKQLNPVGEEESPVFFEKFPEVTLSEIVRQKKGNPIITLSRNLPSLAEKNNVVLEGEEVGYCFSRNKEKLIEELVASNGSKNFKYLAWTNAVVNSVNKIVRQKIYGDNPKKIEIGETLLFDKPYMSIYCEDTYLTNQEITVETCDENLFEFSYPHSAYSGFSLSGEVGTSKKITLKAYIINNPAYKAADKKPHGIVVLHEDSEIAFQKLLKTMVQRCRGGLLEWKRYYDFKGNFGEMKYTHALTVHKSQGSTYKKVAVNLTDIQKNRSKKERDRLLYTAITRASDFLVFI